MQSTYWPRSHLAGYLEWQITHTRSVTCCRRGKAAAHTSSYWLLLMYEQCREFVLRLSPEEENHWHVSSDRILLDDLAKRGQAAVCREWETDPSEKLSNVYAHGSAFSPQAGPLSPIHSDVTGLLWKPCSVSAINRKLYYCMRQQLLNVTVRIISKLGLFSYGCAMLYCCLLNSQIRSSIACGILIKLMS